MKKSILALVTAMSLLSVSPTFSQVAVPDLRVCTGGTTGKYYQTAREIGVQLKGLVNVIPVETNGSMDNFARIAAGQCDAAIVQSDAYGIYAETYPTVKLDFRRVAPLYQEYVHLICNKEAGIHSVKDTLREGVKVLIGPNGSGTAVTWETWGKQNEAYSKVQTDPEGGMIALTTINDGTEAQCALFVSGLNSGTMNEYNELGGDNLQLVSIDDGSFDDVMDPKGNRVYAFTDVPSGTYPNLQNSGWFGSGNSVKTLAIDAVMISATAWVEANPRGFESLSKAALRWANTN